MAASDWLTLALGIICGVVVPAVAWIANGLGSLRNSLGDHKTHVAENYATKDDVRELGDRMERQMEKGFENIEKLITNGKTS